MRVPTRRSDKVPRADFDFKITLKKFEKLKSTLKHLKDDIRPKEVAIVKELSTTGDYSENAGYQLAKAKLRRTNNRISKIEQIISKADIIEISKNNSTVQIGNRVELDLNGAIKKYQILGSAETNPSLGCISYSSPLGSLLLNKKVGDVFSLNDREYRVIRIS